MGTTLASLVNIYGQDPHGSARHIRDLLESDRASFFGEALQCLSVAQDERGIRYLLAVMVTSGLLLEGISHPSFSRERAMDLARMAAKVGPPLGAAVVRRLKDPTQPALDDAGISRLLEILDAVSEGSPPPALAQLTDHPDERVRSKAALIIGRGNRSSRWVERQLKETDPRIRANAIEALWDVQGEHCRQVLWNATDDSNNRVAGNALLALYRLAEPTSIPRILEMLSDLREVFRMTAAWIMGQSRDPRFLPALAPLIATAGGGLRRRAFAAVSSIKQFVSQVQHAGTLPVGAADCKSGEAGWRRVRVVVGAIRPDMNLAVTSFVLSVNGAMVTQFRAVLGDFGEALSAGFVTPCQFGAPAVDLMGQCINLRRANDFWAAVKYGSGGACGAEQPIPFAADAAALSRSLAVAGLREQATPDLDTALGRIARGISTAHGSRNIVVAEYQDRVSPPVIQEMARLAGVSAITFHAVSDNAQSALRDLCRSTGGLFVAAGEDTFAGLMECIGRSLVPWGEIEFRPPCEGPLRIQVYAPEGYSEVIL